MNEFSPTLVRLSDRRGDSTPTRHLVLDFSYRQVRRVLWSISLAVIALGLFHQVYVQWAPPSMYGFRELINFDSEKSIPTWWSFLLLIAVALIVLLNGLAEPNRKWKPHWLLLGAIFVFLSIDEFAGIHERLVGVLAPYHFTGVLRFSWVIPYGLLCLLGAAFYQRFALSFDGERCSPAASTSRRRSGWKWSEAIASASAAKAASAWRSLPRKPARSSAPPCSSWSCSCCCRCGA
jgi:hypothetical protein